ncbi:MAG: hypothetical protein K1Y02_02865 [Candidatus Hydrogenedentes bacterium]|nr:hypothetical protein [Candidatus Hydrogenedentota bacterium]
MHIRSLTRSRWPVLAGLLLTVWTSLAASAAPALRVEGDHFTVDGHPRFLVLVSYFDAMRASDATLDTDFEYFRSVGVDGIRVFPNWWNCADMTHFPDDTLMDATGAIRPDRLARLKPVLDKASSMGFIVDLSFAFETVGGLSALTESQLGHSQAELPVNQVHADAYERGLTETARALRAYRNVFFDIQNEFNGRITHLSDDEVKRFLAAIKAVDPGRIVTASLANEIGPEDVVARSVRLGLDIVAWHESRNPWQYDAMDQLVQRAKQAGRIPIYLGEPASMEQDLGAEEFLTAITKAKSAGAAAWTFHTESGFDLRRAGLTAQLTENEKRFLDTFKAKLNEAPSP